MRKAKGGRKIKCHIKCQAFYKLFISCMSDKAFIISLVCVLPEVDVWRGFWGELVATGGEDPAGWSGFMHAARAGWLVLTPIRAL